MSVQYKGNTIKISIVWGRITLNLSNSGITDINDIIGLETLKNLQTLLLQGNQIMEIKGLENLTNLQTLSLSGNQITEIKGFENLTNLQTLYLQGNQITEIRGLENLTNLQRLYLQGNLITELKGFENLTKLLWIDLKNNSITELNGLENLTKIQMISLKNNPIEKWVVKEFGQNYIREPYRLLNYYRNLSGKSALKDPLTTKITSASQKLRKLEQIYPLPFASYEGNDPYVFVSYSHKDREFIYPEIKMLHSEGFHIWYDEGIPLSKSWNLEVAKALKRCTCFIVFISDNSVQSQNVENEINMALKYKKNTIPIYIEDTELPDGLELQLITVQGIYKNKMEEKQYSRKFDQI